MLASNYLILVVVNVQRVTARGMSTDNREFQRYQQRKKETDPFFVALHFSVVELRVEVSTSEHSYFFPNKTPLHRASKQQLVDAVVSLRMIEKEV